MFIVVDLVAILTLIACLIAFVIMLWVQHKEVLEQKKNDIIPSANELEKARLKKKTQQQKRIYEDFSRRVSQLLRTAGPEIREWSIIVPKDLESVAVTSLVTGLNGEGYKAVVCETKDGSDLLKIRLG